MGPAESLSQLLRPSLLRAEKARLLSAASGAMRLLETWAVSLELPAQELRRAQQRLDGFVEAGLHHPVIIIIYKLFHIIYV